MHLGPDGSGWREGPFERGWGLGALVRMRISPFFEKVQEEVNLLFLA